MLGDAIEVRSLLEPVVERLGYELVYVTLTGSKTRALRMFIDAPGGITVDDCERVSRRVSDVLEVDDMVDGEYSLEVSSPGLHRVLARPKDFTRACGSIVKLTTRTGIEGRRRFQGRLVSFDGSLAELDVDNSRVRIPFGEIERANTVYQFAAKDFDNRVVRPVSERL